MYQLWLMTRAHNVVDVIECVSSYRACKRATAAIEKSRCDYAVIKFHDGHTMQELMQVRADG